MIRRAFILCALLTGVSAALAGPRAGLVPKTWELDFQFLDAQRISVTLPGDATPTTFWYMMYRVTNHTGKDVMFTPSFRIVTDTLEEVVAGDGISPSVYDAVAARHKREFPYFAIPAKVTGKLMQGSVNARSSVAIFKAFNTKAAGFRVYASGLSGDIERMANAAFKPDQTETDSNPRFFLLRRTLELDYDLPGDPETRKYAKAVRRNRQWVMR